jgi:superkiller protein 3
MPFWNRGKRISRRARHLERSIALNPGYSESQAALGSILAKLDDLPGARQHLEKAIALGDADPEVQYDLGNGPAASRRYRTSAGEAAHYQQLKKARSDTTQAAGKAEVGDQAMASRAMPRRPHRSIRKRLKPIPMSRFSFISYPRALDKMKDIAGEKAALQRAIQLNPNLAEAQNQMGYLADRDGDLAQAEGYFRAAVHVSPSYVVAWINLAATLASEAKWQEAKEALGHALEIDPDNAGTSALACACGLKSRPLKAQCRHRQVHYDYTQSVEG